MAKRVQGPKVSFQVDEKEKAEVTAWCQGLQASMKWLGEAEAPLLRAALWVGMARITQDPSVLQGVFRAETRGRKKSKKP